MVTRFCIHLPDAHVFMTDCTVHIVYAQLHLLFTFIGIDTFYYSPLLRCAADACVHVGHEQAPGLWAVLSGLEAQTQSWTHGSTVSHFPATAVSSVPEKYLLLFPTSLQRTRKEKRWKLFVRSTLNP